MPQFKHRTQGTPKQKGQAYPVEESGSRSDLNRQLDLHRNGNGKFEIYNVYHHKKEEFDDAEIKMTKNNHLQIVAEDDEGHEVSQFIKMC